MGIYSNSNSIIFGIQIYTECISTLSCNRDKCMMWQPLSLDTFLEKFGEATTK
jgi:hypothetical protein